MLKHSVVGPDQNGRFFVVYPIPGTPVMAPVLDCRTKEIADREADLLNFVHATPVHEVRRCPLFFPLEGVI